MDTSSLRSLLADLADTPPPPSRVDIRRAAAAGRRTVQIRRIVASGAVAVAVAAIVGLVNAVSLGGSALGPVPQPGTSPQSPSPSTPPMPAAAPESFEPSVQYADFGWLPDGLTGWSLVSVEPDLLQLEAGLPETGPDEEPQWIGLSVVTAGNRLDPTTPGRALSDGTPLGVGFIDAEDLRGRPARWVDPSWAPATILQWEYAPDAWAQVTVAGLAEIGDPRELARQVAESVQFGVNRRIALPIRATGLPDALRLIGVRVSQATSADREPRWSAELHFSSTGARTEFGDWPLSILAAQSSMRTGDNLVTGDPNTTVDGHPARRSDGLDGGKSLQVFDVDGVYVELHTHDAGTTDLLDGGLVGVFRGLEIYRDPARWR